MLSPTLYHFTCDHGAPLIQESGVLMPGSVNGPGTLVWMTDLARPPREAIGLTSYTLGCDRMAWRFTVAPGQDVDAWTWWRRAFDPWWAHLLEGGEWARPRHWFVSAGPVAVERPGVHHAV